MLKRFKNLKTYQKLAKVNTNQRKNHSSYLKLVSHKKFEAISNNANYVLRFFPI